MRTGRRSGKSACPRFSIRKVAGAFALLALLAGCEKMPLTDDLQEAKTAMQQGEWGNAQKLLERFLSTAREPEERWDAWNRLIETSGHVQPGSRWVVDYLETMLMEFEDSPERARDILRRLAEAHEAARRFEHAAETWTQLIESPELPAEESVTVHRRLARIDLLLHRFDAAEDVLESCLELPVGSARHAECLYDLADAAASRDKTEQAATLARQVMDIDGVSPEIRARAGYILADIKEQSGDLKGALELFEAIKDAYPNEMVVDYRILTLKKQLKIK